MWGGDASPRPSVTSGRVQRDAPESSATSETRAGVLQSLSPTGPPDDHPATHHHHRQKTAGVIGDESSSPTFSSSSSSLSSSRRNGATTASSPVGMIFRDYRAAARAPAIGTFTHEAQHGDRLDVGVGHGIAIGCPGQPSPDAAVGGLGPRRDIDLVGDPILAVAGPPSAAFRLATRQMTPELGPDWSRGIVPVETWRSPCSTPRVGRQDICSSVQPSARRSVT